jgi:hypothetical protein
MGIGPRQHLLRGKRGQVIGFSNAATFGQNFCQGCATALATRSIAQCCIHCQPGFSRSIANRTIPTGRPFAFMLVVGIRPGKNLFDRVVRQQTPVALSALFQQQFGQGRTTRQTSMTFYERLIHRTPG